MKFDAFCEQSNCNTLWLPNMGKILLLLLSVTRLLSGSRQLLFFYGKNIHLWYILLYQTSDNLQIIHVHVSHFVIYEKNILITLRFVAKKKKKKKKKYHLSKSAKLLFYSSQEKHICPVSLANSFSSQTKSSRPSFVSFRWSACFKCYQFSSILDKVKNFMESPVSHFHIRIN